MVVILANQDLLMSDDATTPRTPDDKAAAPATPLNPSLLAAVVQARYILDLSRR
jgi:hypothetical protein